ncbi:MAG: class I SAM-dependent methyltransferase [Spirochaetes bacterium]|nr:class I SAM-dependent methyltransferase [Spirochaetota bacterium]
MKKPSPTRTANRPKPKLGPLHGGVAPLFMVAQVPFNRDDAVKLNTPMIQIMDDSGNVGVLTMSLKELGVWDRMLAPGAKCLELGCGSGYQLEKLYGEGRGAYFGLEPIASEAEKARKRIAPFLAASKASPRDRVKHAPLEKVQWERASFDVVYSYHVFEHLENPLVMVDRARLWLKPGGILVIICPNVEGALPRRDLSQWRQALPSHRWLPGVSTVRRILVERGFRVLKSFTYGGHPAPRSLWQEWANRTYKWRGLGDVLSFAATPENAPRKP